MIGGGLSHFVIVVGILACVVKLLCTIRFGGRS